jgi:protein-S-isoprenylcysteine O-methyltransferase Ste14
MHDGIWTHSLVNFDIVFVIIYLAWILLEFKVAKREVRQGTNISDFGTCEFYAAGQALTFLSALWFDSMWAAPHIGHLCGFIIFVSGIGWRLWAINSLGRYYSHIVREVDEHRIIDLGPYRFMRHPAYAGMIGANLGITIYFLNWVTLLIFLFLLIPAIVLRIIVEEKTLFKIQGYSDFAKNRKRLFPALW